MLRSMHPAVYVTAGFFLMILVQRVSGEQLLWWVMVLGVGAIYLAGALVRRLLVRLRYVFLALLLLFAWQTPGTLVLPEAGVLSPTVDGVQAFMMPCLRLLGVVSVVAVMLRYLTRTDWVIGMHVMMFPLRAFGFSPERFAVRLYLVLALVDQPDTHWRRFLDEDDVGLEEEGRAWMLRGLGIRDWLGLAVLSGLFCGGLWW